MNGGFSGSAGSSFSDIAVPGQITVIDVSGYASAASRQSVRALVISLISKKLFSERMEVRKEEEYRDIKTYTDLYILMTKMKRAKSL